MRKLLAPVLALVLLAGAPLLPASAAGEALHYILEATPGEAAAGETFAVTVSLRAEGGWQPSALRFYLLYDSTRFALQEESVQRHGLVAGGMFGFRDASGEPGKYPAGMSEAEREAYGAAVMQWCSLPEGAALPRIDAAKPTPVVTLAFLALEAMAYPAPGGIILLSADYGPADTPYLDDVPVDVSLAEVTVDPLSPPPEISVAAGQDIVIDGNYIYGFDPAMTVQGSVRQWDDSLLEQYFDITDGGKLKADHRAKPENRALAGTGTQLVLWNAKENRSHGAYTMLVFGDLDGNFLVDLDDYSKARTLAFGPVGDDPVRIAADVTEPFGIFNEADLQAIYGAAIGTGSVAQRQQRE